MKRYLILRVNQEFGPYSVEDLNKKGLMSYDLIWVEGKSVRWMYPSEIPELADVPVNAIQKKEPAKEKPRQIILETYEPAFLSDPVLEADERPASPAHHKFSFVNETRNNGLWIIGLVIALVSSAFVVKSIVENFDENPYKQEIAVAALPVEEPLPHSYVDDPAFTNALSTEIVAVDTTVSKPVAKKKPAMKDLKKQVSIKASEFKPGVLGGINDLELTIKNGSTHKLDRVTVEVKFLKPNGDVVKTEHFDVNSLPAGGRKVLPVPASQRGVKVKYRVVAVESVQQKASYRNA